MKHAYRKEELPVHEVRKFLEPGPIVLVSARYRNKTNIMTMGWHTVMEFSPSLIGCMITSANHSYELIRKSGECVINIPTADLLTKVIGIGNTSGSSVNKFEKFRLTAEDAQQVKAPLIKECYAHFECRIADRRMLNKYNFFIFEVVHAQAAVQPKFPRTVHYRGDGTFMISGSNISRRSLFKAQNL